MYSKATHDRHMEALDAAESAISASIARTPDYGQRLEKFMDDYLEISVMFWDRCPITKKKLEKPGYDARKCARQFNSLINSQSFTMWERTSIEQMIERCRRKVKGQLFNTRMILSDKDAKSNCDNELDHKQPCQCKLLNLFRLAESRAL